MSDTNKSGISTSIEEQVRQIVQQGEEFRNRLTDFVKQSAATAQQTSEELIQSVIKGAEEGAAQSKSVNKEHVLYQVIDALGDGFEQTALAGQLAIEEAKSNLQSFADEDIARLRNDLSSIHSLFTETITKALNSTGDLTSGEITNATTHADSIAKKLGPVVAEVLDVIRAQPLEFAKEGLQSGAAAGRSATGALFQSLGQMLQKAGDKLRQESTPEA